MATLQELSEEDFQKFANNKTASIEFFNLSNNEQTIYKANYKKNFSAEFKNQINQLVETANIDRKTAGQILFRAVKRAHNNNDFFIDSSNSASTKFTQIANTVKIDLQNGKYDELIQKNNLKTESQDINRSENKIVDFNNPAEKKAFFSNLFNEYSNLKTEEEKEAFKRINFADYDTYKKEIDSYLIYKTRMKELKEENPEMTHKERSKQVCKELGQTKEEMNINKEITELTAQNKELEKRLEEIKNIESTEAIEIQEKLKYNTKRLKELDKNSNKTKNKEEINNSENISANSQEDNTLNTNEFEDFFNDDFNNDESISIEEINSSENINTNSEEENTLDINEFEDFFNDESINIEEINELSTENNNEFTLTNNSSDPEIKKIEKGQINSFGMYIDNSNEEEFENTNNTIENSLIEIPKKNLFDKFKDTVFNIKDTVIKRVNNIKKSLSNLIKKKPEIPALNTAENNTPTLKTSETLSHVDGIENKTNPNINKDLLNSNKSENSNINVKDKGISL